MILEFDSADRAPSGAAAWLHRQTVRAALASVGRTPSGKLGMALTAIVVMTALMAPWLASVDPFALAGASLASPSGQHWMGTDALGRDLYSGVVHGTRTSLLVATAVSAITLLCGMAIGLVGGYAGGWLDDALLRITELLQVLPRFFLVIVVVALLGPGLDHLILTLGLTSWPVLARVVRGEVLALREADFVTAAEASGATRMHILWRTLLPNVMPAAIVVVGLLFGQVLLIEASLGFLGLGDPNAMSWGLLAGQAQPLFRVAWWLSFFPGVAITLAVLGVNLLADAMSASLGGGVRSAPTSTRATDRIAHH